MRISGKRVLALIGASHAGRHISRLLTPVVMFFALVGCVPAVAPLAPVPPGAGKSPYYFPTRVGTKWVYQENGGDEYTMTVTVVEEKDGRFTVTVATTSHDDPDGLEPGIATYLVSKDGVFCAAEALESATEKQEFFPPVCLLKLSHTPGDKWGGDPKTGKGPYVAGKIESIKVPAGTYEAIRVDREVPSGMEGVGEGHYTFWFAPGVGAVRKKDQRQGRSDEVVHTTQGVRDHARSGRGQSPNRSQGQPT